MRWINRNPLFLFVRVYTIKSSQEQNFKSRGTSILHRSSLFPPVEGVNSIRPFSTPLPASAFKKSDTEGGMHQLVKLRYLTSSPAPLPREAAHTPSSSYDIISFRDLKLELVTKISISRPRLFPSRSTTRKTSARKYLSSFRGWSFFSRSFYFAIYLSRLFRLILQKVFLIHALSYIRTLFQKDLTSLSGFL